LKPPADDARSFDRILERVRQAQGFDGAQYKPNYMKRRIAVRMRAVGAETYREYLRILEKDPLESEQLSKRLTIHVTDFFRDPEVYEDLPERISKISEGLMDPTTRNSRFRIWSAGCSTGEEPYSLALVFHEWAEKHSGFDFEILATDIDDPSVATARQGEYPESAFSKMPGRRFNRWFKRDGAKVRAGEALRQKVRFETRDLLGSWEGGGEAFHLIFCRNLLIYLGARQQQKLFERFHGVLAPKGCLVLGKTEALLGPARRFFECVDIPNRIYRAVSQGRRDDLHLLEGADIGGE